MQHLNCVELLSRGMKPSKTKRQSSSLKNKTATAVSQHAGNICPPIFSKRKKKELTGLTPMQVAFTLLTARRVTDEHLA